MKLRHLVHCSVACLATILLAACGSQKAAVNTTSANTIPTSANRQNNLEAMLSNRLRVSNVTAKVKVRITLDGRSISTTGTLRMRRDDVIQISLVDPFVGITEIGRMEFSPTNVLIIDRFNKQYIDVPYADVAFLQRAGVDFSVLQSLFWNELFQPGQARPQLSGFVISNEGSGVQLACDAGLLHYLFLAFPDHGLLQRTTITSPSDPSARFTFNYDSFEAFETRQFPCDMTMSFQMGVREASLGFVLSNLRSNSDWPAHTPAPTKYTKADPEKIFRSLVK